VRTVAELLALIRSGVGREEFLTAARERSQGRFTHGCSPYLCYFPELIPVSPMGRDRKIPLNPPLPKGDENLPHPPFPEGDGKSGHPPLPKGERGGFDVTGS
jgi:hypothetical protein